jgi:hypothetical protein
MQRAAAACQLERILVSRSGLSGQSRYEITFDSAQPNADAKLACYQQRLETMGVRRTLAGGSPGFDPASAGPDLVPTQERCGLPEGSFVSVEDGSLAIFGRGEVPQEAIDCATDELRKLLPGRRIVIRDGQPARMSLPESVFEPDSVPDAPHSGKN